MILFIAAIDRKRGIAKHGGLPWYIPEDERFFTTQTKTRGGNVLTGGKTFRDTYKGKPLAGRQNYILTRREESIEGVTVVHDLMKLLDEFNDRDLWISGGVEVFKEIMAAGKADELYLTHIDADFGCDQFLPEYEEGFKKVEESEIREQNGFRFTYAKYARVDDK
jgi:dihydrofolate reductase